MHIAETGQAYSDMRKLIFKRPSQGPLHFSINNTLIFLEDPPVVMIEDRSWVDQ